MMLILSTQYQNDNHFKRESMRGEAIEVEYRVSK